MSKVENTQLQLCALEKKRKILFNNIVGAAYYSQNAYAYENAYTSLINRNMYLSFILKMQHLRIRIRIHQRVCEKYAAPTVNIFLTSSCFKLLSLKILFVKIINSKSSST